jgi:hypothetical protein
MAVNFFGLPIDFTLSGGEVLEYKVAPQFLETLPLSHYVIADKGYDSEALRMQIANTSAIAVIPRFCERNLKPGLKGRCCIKELKE